jgi:hypothetical protein
LGKISRNPVDVALMKLAIRKSRPLVLFDWRHVESSELWIIQQRTGIDPICMDSVLFNGKGAIKCATEEERRDGGPLMGPVLEGKPLTAKG